MEIQDKRGVGGKAGQIHLIPSVERCTKGQNTRHTTALTETYLNNYIHKQ